MVSPETIKAWLVYHIIRHCTKILPYFSKVVNLNHRCFQYVVDFQNIFRTAFFTDHL